MNVYTKLQLTPGKCILIGTIFLLLLFDIYLILSGQEHMSNFLMNFHANHLWFGVATGIVVGHLFWPQKFEVKT